MSEHYATRLREENLRLRSAIRTQAIALLSLLCTKDEQDQLIDALAKPNIKFTWSISSEPAEEPKP